jgi:hypothetical protein
MRNGSEKFPVTEPTAMPIRNDYKAINVPGESRPPLRIPWFDPVFGTVVTRVTDPNMALNDGDNHTLGLRHEYARYPGLNADGTLALVQVIGGLERGAYKILECETGRLWPGPRAVGGDCEGSWHPTDAHRLLHRCGNEVRIFHVDTGSDTLLHAFPNYTSVSTNQEGRPSDDWQYWAGIAYKDEAQSRPDLVVADLYGDVDVAKLKDVGGPNWCGMSPTGRYVVLQYGDSRGTQLYDRNLNFVRTLIRDYSHSDFAYDEYGEEVLVYQPSSGAAIAELGCPNPPNGQPIASVRLADGEHKILLGECNTRDWQPVVTGTALGWSWFGCHFSGIASRLHPGWVLVSTYTDPHNEQEPFSREIFWLKLDGSGMVKRIAHHHSDCDTRRGERDYWSENHATSSWDGNTVVFASNWNEPWNHYDLYTLSGDWF